MQKKLLILVFSLHLLSISCYANTWNDIEDCLQNICNCGEGNRYEEWDGDTQDKGPKNRHCPPYNKSKGRDGTCLTQFEYPQPGIPAYIKVCAEDTGYNTYFNPQIRVRHQTCNPITCWNDSTTLSWDGECVLWPGPVGLPMNRICARIAFPKNQDKGISADPGYTLRKHLDDDGVTVDDDVIYGVDGKPIVLDPPKLCAYLDPSLLESGALSSTFHGSASALIPDIMDINPLKQPIHKTTSLHPLVKVILFIMQHSGNQGMSNMLNLLFNSLEGQEIPGLDTIKLIMDMYFEIRSYMSSDAAMVAAMQEFGQINRVVLSNLGCVNIPIGPYPPPYCNQLSITKAPAITHDVCPLIRDESGILIPKDSTSDKPCVVSNLVNNALHNTIRISIDKMVPLCLSGQHNSDCVTIRNINAMPSILHIMTTNKDIVPACSSSTTNSPCIEIDYNKCDQNAIGCQSEYRIVYQSKTGTKSSINSYFSSDLADCALGINNNCQAVWGVNAGTYQDTALIFPEIETYGNWTPLQHNLSITDHDGNERNFTIAIVRTITEKSNITQEPYQICVFEGNVVIGCQERQPLPKPKIYDCTNPPQHISLQCQSTHYEPKFIASIKIDNNHSSVIVEPLSLYNQNSNRHQVNLGGYDFTSFVTDKNYTTMPFSGSNSHSPSSIYGDYVVKSKYDGYYASIPYGVNKDGEFYQIPNVQYVKGLEYINGKYIRGGDYTCLQFDQREKCSPSHTKNCILTKLTNPEVDCNKLFNAIETYRPLYKCEHVPAGNIDTIISYASYAGLDQPIETIKWALGFFCNTAESIPYINKSGNLSIYDCPKWIFGYDYCYDGNICEISNHPNDRYIPDPSFGEIIPDDKYYDLNNPSQVGEDNRLGFGKDYDTSIYALRDKTSIEMGLCVAVPPPDGQCDAMTENNINWSSANPGEYSIGQCIPGAYKNYSYVKFERLCIHDLSSGKAQLEDITELQTCTRTICPDVYYSKSGQEISQSEFDILKVKEGAIIFWKVDAGTTSSLRCMLTDKDINIVGKNDTLRRKCILDGSEAKWEEIDQKTIKDFVREQCGF